MTGKMRFVIREEEPWFSWFYLAATGISIAFLAYTLWGGIFNMVTVIAGILILLIFVRFFDDFIHTSW